MKHTSTIKLCAGVLLALVATAASAAAPWTDAEVERRLDEGAALGAKCRAEASHAKQVTTAGCLEFSSWLHKDFPLLAENLPAVLGRSPRAADVYSAFIADLEFITQTGERSDDVDRMLDAPPKGHL